MNHIVAQFKTMLLLSVAVSAVSTTCAIDKTQIGYVLGKYQHTIRNRECLFYPAKNPKRLLILFNGLPKNKYIMWSWFWRDNEDWTDTAYLFLKDDDGCWYLGNEEKSFIEDYSAIIEHFMAQCNLTKDKVFTIGGSMGAYGAIFYATRLGLKAALAVNPQVNRASQLIRTRGFNDIGSRWHELEHYVAQSLYVPAVSIIYSYCPRDQANGHALVDVLKQKGSLVIVRRHHSEYHSGAATLTKEFVENEIEYFEKQDPPPSDA